MTCCYAQLCHCLCPSWLSLIKHNRGQSNVVLCAVGEVSNLQDVFGKDAKAWFTRENKHKGKTKGKGMESS